MTEDPFLRDVRHTFQSSPNDEMTCKCCDVKYTRGDWDFYSLCDPCFKVFDAQKMRRRFAFAGSWLRTHGDVSRDTTELPAATEDVDEFINAHVCPHKVD